MDSILRKALLNWFALAPDSSLEKVEEMYVNGDLNCLYRETQKWLSGQGIHTLNCFRWESGIRNNPILQSWSLDKRVAESYKELRPGHLVEKTFHSSKVLFDVCHLSEVYELDDELGVMPCSEVVIILQEGEICHVSIK